MLIFIRFPAVLALAFGIAAASAADLADAVTAPPTLIISEPVLTSTEIAARLPAAVLVRPVLRSGSGPADFLDALRAATGRQYDLPDSHARQGHGHTHHEDTPHVDVEPSPVRTPIRAVGPLGAQASQPVRGRTPTSGGPAAAPPLQIRPGHLQPGQAWQVQAMLERLEHGPVEIELSGWIWELVPLTESERQAVLPSK